ncbi:MAG: radical SAM protein [Helicobacter sp.]|nr:radical SAM protein [Helicobacter sp.]
MDKQQYVLEKITSAGGGRYLEEFLSFPRYFQIETIQACNARCVMCGIEEWKRENAKMEDWIFEKILAEIKEHIGEIQRVSAFLGGEPLLDKGIAKKIALLKQAKVPSVYITTNASLLDRDRALELLQSGIDQVDISFDSLDQQIYEKIRVNLKFKVVRDNILSFIALRNQGGYKTRIRIRMTEMDCNNKELQRMQEYFAPYLILEGDCVYSKDLQVAFMESGITQEKKDFVGEKSYALSKLNCEALPCYAIWNTIVILSDGRVGLCCVDMGRNVIIGDLRKSSIQEIWRESKELRAIRKTHLEVGRGGVLVCKGCNTWS